MKTNGTAEIQHAVSARKKTNWDRYLAVVTKQATGGKVTPAEVASAMDDARVDIAQYQNHLAVLTRHHELSGRASAADVTKAERAAVEAAQALALLRAKSEQSSAKFGRDIFEQQGVAHSAQFAAERARSEFLEAQRLETANPKLFNRSDDLDRITPTHGGMPFSDASLYDPDAPFIEVGFSLYHDEQVRRAELLAYENHRRFTLYDAALDRWRAGGRKYRLHDGAEVIEPSTPVPIFRKSTWLELLSAGIDESKRLSLSHELVRPAIDLSLPEWKYVGQGEIQDALL
ncbi:MAG: hypothetical protein HJJLKODD_02526 [Phycisphaerae bacterium]|nr:hypothetical protein [Phycisphaerae bacterium]